MPGIRRKQLILMDLIAKWLVQEAGQFGPMPTKADAVEYLRQSLDITEEGLNKIVDKAQEETKYIVYED